MQHENWKGKSRKLARVDRKYNACIQVSAVKPHGRLYNGPKAIDGDKLRVRPREAPVSLGNGRDAQ